MTTLVTHDRLPRISWGAVFAGVILSLAVLLVLGILGAAIGASALAPLQYQDPARGFAFGTGIWAVFMTVAAVLTGAYFAGRCAPALGWLHGILAWAVVVLLTGYFATTLVGNTVSFIGNVAATTAQATSDSGQIGKTANSLINSAKQTLQQHGINVPGDSAQAVAPSDTQMRESADSASRQVARTTWWAFALLVLGAIIATAAAQLGFRHQPAVEAGERERVDPVPVTTTTYTERTTTTGLRRPV
jgi:hypothetical protein